ncbi:YfcE family phosphodiesterase [Gehongia tenuis]|uniref:Phosphoesterase n=1 Tax=Gehongia tenuis TaxID=2763655 RepID=A0A926D6C6_9FIRM|nr:metallophosphoesterase [Gehongia tenuis]MBC8532167.1 metallophosphoesterase [Gehongia tenuis]
MILAVLSDTHGSLIRMKQWMEQLGPVDGIIHLGDHWNDLDKLNADLPCPLYTVKGNCDYGDGDTENILSFMGHRIFITHGHTYRAKMGTALIAERARELGAEAALYGHTHQRDIHYESGVLMMNPGSLGRSLDHPSYGILVVNKEGIVPKLQLLNG